MQLPSDLSIPDSNGTRSQLGQSVSLVQSGLGYMGDQTSSLRLLTCLITQSWLLAGSWSWLFAWSVFVTCLITALVMCLITVFVTHLTTLSLLLAWSHEVLITCLISLCAPPPHYFIYIFFIVLTRNLFLGNSGSLSPRKSGGSTCTTESKVSGFSTDFS